MTKRILTLILTLCLAVAAMTVMAFAEIASGTAWVLDDDGTLSFSGSEGMNEWTEIYRATYCEEVTSVVFYDGIVYIPDNAFDGCSNLTSIAIPDTVTEIGNEAFYGCSSLTTVTIPSSVEMIGSSAFSGCSSLQSFVIENCGLEFHAANSGISEDKITQSAHTYSGGVCSACNHTDSDYVIVGSAELHDGYYTEYGTNAVYDDPTVDSNITSYAYYSNGVLYLYNFYYTTSGTTAYQATIEPSEGDLTISLSGYNTIGGETYGIHSNVGSITLVSTDTENMGSLTINTNTSLLNGFSRGIYCSSDVVIDGVSVTISSGEQSIYSASGNIYIKNGAVYSANNSLNTSNNIAISDSTVEVIVNFDDYAIGCEYVYITASNVTLSGTLDIFSSLTMTAATG